MLKARGLNTYNNNLSEIPEGSLSVADNVVIDRNGVIEPRRGFKQYGTEFGIGTDRAKQLMVYKDRLIRHYSDVLQYDNGSGTFTSFAGSYLETETGLRIKSVEANGNFFFTTSTGIKKISASDASQFTSATGYIRNAGGIEALDLTGVVDYTNAGFFTPSSKVAYRLTWASKDANDNLIEGAPSSRLVMVNYSLTDSGVVTLTFAIPSEIGPTDTQFYYRLYRTAVIQTSTGVTLEDIDPGDEMNLVIEEFPTAAELVTREITVTDITPEAFRQGGALLYTNPVSGEGILQSNFAPPLAKDIALFQSSVFYANTQTKQSFNLALLSVSALISGTSSITITQGSVINTYIFRGSKEVTQFTFDTAVATTDGGYFLVNSASNARRYFVWFGKTGEAERTIFTFDTVANTTNGGYFLLNSANDASQYFVWFDKTGATPVPVAADTVGRIGLRVSLVSLTTASEVATAVAAVLPTSDFDSTPNVDTVTVLNTEVGVTTDAADGLTPVGGVFGFTIIDQGVDATPQPSAADTIGRLPLFADIGAAVSAADVATAAALALNTVIDFSAVPVGAVVTNTNTDNGKTDDATNGLTPIGGVFAIVVTVQGTGEGDPEITQFTFDTFANTANGSYFLLNSAQNEVRYFVWFDKTGATPAPAGADTIGKTGIHVIITGLVTAAQIATAVDTQLDLLPAFISDRVSNVITVTNAKNGPTIDASAGLVPPGGAFAILVTQQGNNYVLLGGSGSPSQNIDETARSLVNAINNNSAESVNAFYTSGPDDVPGLIRLESRTLAGGTFYLTANSTATGNSFSPSLPTSGQTAISTDEVEPNALYYSKFQQPEAVPIVNKFNVGPKDKAILRILPLRTGLMVFKEDGIYRVTGQNAQFVLDPFDNSAIILAADSAVVLNNQVYMLSTQGIVTVTDTGVSVISRPIEDKLDKIMTQNYDFRPNTFGVAYETDRAYLMWTVTNINDDQPTQCFRFNTFTTAWTRFPIAKNCGLVKPDQNRLYLGPGDENFIEQERKDFLRTDHADREYPVSISANGVSDLRITLSSTDNVLAGDVILQTQYLTLYQYNQLLRMLDLDPGVGYDDYVEELEALPGANMRNAVDNLALKLDTDPGLLETNFFSSLGGGPTFPDFQSDFNIIIGLLNLNANAAYNNYKTSVGTVTFDVLIEAKIKNSSDVSIKYNTPVYEGPVTLSRGIKAEVVWSPQSFGDASIAKQIREGTFLFENTVFYSANVSYASDLSPDFESVDFTESGLGDWGSFVWNVQNWGGDGSQVPFRTYIPRSKQRCRFLRPRFVHIISRENFALFGLSLTFRPLTERAYRE